MLYEVMKEIVFSNHPHGAVVTHRYSRGTILDSEDKDTCPEKMLKTFLKIRKLKEVDATQAMPTVTKKPDIEKVIETTAAWGYETKSQYPGFNELTDKENAILSLTYRDKFTEIEIAERMGVKPASLKAYHSKILRKLKVKSLDGAIKKVNEKIESQKKSTQEGAEKKEETGAETE